MKISVVTTLYNSSAYVEEFHLQVNQLMSRLGLEYELVFVDDGSPDDSLDKALQVFEKNKQVKVVTLMKNYGHHKAIMAGLKESSGEMVFLIDSDLEESPELLENFLKVQKETAADVVYGVQTQRKGNWIEKISGDVFYRIFNALSEQPIPKNFVTARLMTRQMVECLLGFQERELYLGGIWSLVGGKQVAVPVVKKSTSQSTYTFRRKVSLFVNAITSFSNKPLIFIFYLGFTISSLAALAALSMVIRKLFFGAVQTGWASLMVSIWFLGGLNIFVLGIIGIYLAKVFSESKQRPFVQVRKTYHH